MSNTETRAPALIPGMRARSWLLFALVGVAAWWWCSREPEPQAVRQARIDLVAADDAIEADPRDLAARRKRANALLVLGRGEDSLTEWERVLELAPDVAWAHAGRGCALRALKRPVAAMAACRKALALDARRGGSHFLHAMLLFDQGLLGESLHAFDRALACERDVPIVHLNRGVVLMRLDRPSDALASFDCAVRLAPGDRLTHYNRGHALRVLGRFREAHHALRRALEIDPEFEEAQQELALVDEIIAGQDMVETIVRGVSELVERHQ